MTEDQQLAIMAAILFASDQFEEPSDALASAWEIMELAPEFTKTSPANCHPWSGIE